MVIFYAPKFRRVFKKISEARKQKVVLKLKILRKNPRSPKLNVHKLKNSDFFSLWIEYDFRVLFKFEKNRVILLDLGDHNSIY